MSIKDDLVLVIQQHKDDKLVTGQTDIAAMAKDCLNEIMRLEGVK